MTIGDHHPTPWAETPQGHRTAPATTITPAPAGVPAPWDYVPSALPPVPAEVAWARWIWLVVPSVGAVVAAVTADITGFPVLLDAFAIAAALLAVISLPAAVALPRGSLWSRRMLLVMSALSFGTTYRCVRLGMWPALAFNLPLLVTFWLLRAPASKAYFAAHDQRRATAAR
jgi:hypothetical protein